jgi:hypothetical protein
MVLFRWGLYVSLGVLATAAAAAAVYTIRGVLTEALIALFLAISLDPAVRMLMRWRIQRGVAILVVVLVALGLTAAFLQSVVPALVDQFQAMMRDFPHYMANLQHRSASFRQITDRFHLTTQANSLLARLPGELGGGAVGFTRRTFSTRASAVLVAVLTIYFLADLPRLQRGAVLLFPRAGPVRPDRRRDGRQGRLLHDREHPDLPDRRRGGVRRAHRAGRAVRRAAGLPGRSDRPHPPDRRDPRCGDLHRGGAVRHPPVADHSTRARLLRGVPADRELPDRAADHARAGPAQRRPLCCWPA